MDSRLFYSSPSITSSKPSHKSATPIANPPTIPDPRPTTLCAPDVPEGDGSDETAEGLGELVDTTPPVPLLAAEGAGVGAEVPEEPTAVEQVTSSGRFVTPAVPQNVLAKSVAAF